MTIKIPLFDIKTVHDTLVSVTEAMIDPLTIPEDEEDAPATLLFNKVSKSLPSRTELISMFEGVKAICYIKNIEQYETILNYKNSKAHIVGAIVILMSGHDDETEEISKHYADIVAGYLENEDLLGITGCKIYPIDNNPQDWEILNMLDEGNMPLLNTFAVVGFKIVKTRNAPITLPED